MTDKQTLERIDQLVKSQPVILFMKGTPQAPMCGFSANTARILRDVLDDDFATVNVLEDQAIREGIKEYGQWPTIPQLYVDGELVGGNDIVTEMYNTGELHALLGMEAPDRTPPTITITDEARQHIESGIAELGDQVLYLNIDDQFNTRFSVEQPKGYEIIADAGGIPIYMDIGTAKRSDGIEIDWVDDIQGSGLVIRNPNEPAPIKQISAAELKQRLQAGESLHIFDVRSDQQMATGTVPGARRLDKDSIATIEKMPKDTPLVFVCNMGNTSQGAAEFFRKKGFVNVHNLAGGMAAWQALDD